VQLLPLQVLQAQLAQQERLVLRDSQVQEEQVQLEQLVQQAQQALLQL
jgi:hypothetical protein